MAEADARIAAAREVAVGHIRTVASDTAKSVAARLIGVDVDDAALEAAVASSMTEGK
jgi:F0F1-type ATP synthase membrane subunit b/b'